MLVRASGYVARTELLSTEQVMRVFGSADFMQLVRSQNNGTCVTYYGSVGLTHYHHYHHISEDVTRNHWPCAQNLVEPNRPMRPSCFPWCFVQCQQDFVTFFLGLADFI